MVQLIMSSTQKTEPGSGSPVYQPIGGYFWNCCGMPRGMLMRRELYRRATAKDDSISPATVYRSLNLFKELGLVDEMRLGKVRCLYEIKQTPEHRAPGRRRGAARLLNFKILSFGN